MRSSLLSHQPFKSLAYYLLIVLSIFSILFMISCNDHIVITEEPQALHFDDTFIRYSDYIQSSIPAFGINTNILQAQQERALIYWYNILPSDVTMQDLLGEDVKVSPDKAQIHVLDLVFDPTEKGIYNTGELSSDPKINWAGMFRSLPDSISQKFEKNNLVMKIWLKIIDAPPDAELNIDLGKISEDILPNGKLDTEDKNLNYLLDDGEDTGIDGIFDNLEPAYHSGNDPNNDDFQYQLGSTGGYKYLNGLENNGVSFDDGKNPDSEDLNHNLILDISNDYFSYTIPLDINKIIRDRIVEYDNNNWILIKIPVDLPDLRVGSPNVNDVETLRLWITNADREVHVRIAEIKFDEI